MLVEMRAKKKSSVMLRSCAHKVAAAGEGSLGCAPGEARRREVASHFSGSAGTRLDDEEDEAEEEEQNPPCLAHRLGVLRAPCLVSRIRLACGIRPLEPSEPTFNRWNPRTKTNMFPGASCQRRDAAVRWKGRERNIVNGLVEAMGA
jgi:hypothetical protein